MKILITGGSGLLGKEILKIDTSIIAPSHAEMDITNVASVREVINSYLPDVVLHLAAATNPPEHERNPEKGLTVNILGTVHIAQVCLEHKVRLVYTSTDYLYVGTGPHREDEPIFPPYKFGWSKLGGESAVALCPRSLILRLSFGSVPFPWDKVYEGQYTSKLYVDEMAPLVLAAAKSQAEGIMNVGGPRTTLEEYAKRTKPDIQTMTRPAWVPADISLDLSKMKKELGVQVESEVLRHKLAATKSIK